ncbi:MAG: chromosomal replication initiator protein DnaA [Proteobacteria bacterium]|nr:chromosomal replication initiator protein DnaA [Pseudomonadota bacterium]
MIDKIWEKSLNLIEERLNNQAFNTWFKPIKKTTLSENRFVLKVPNKFFEDWIRDNYLEIVQNVVKDVSKKDLKIAFEIELKDSPDAEPAEVKVEKKAPQASVNENHRGLSERYTFDNFVVGASNQFSHAASLAVAENPGATYNPLFLYGGAGLGKTHLLCAIGHHLCAKKPSAKICYIRAETFMNELINGIRYEKMNKFREKYRHMDLLLIDDIQFIAGKERTQEEFFHTFNALYESHKQIVVASDKYPKNMPELDDRLRSRFEWGLVADIQPPDTETKIAILKKKADLNNITLPNDVAFFLASNIHSNVRELEGLFNRLCAFSSLNKTDITTDFAKEVLKDFLAKRDKYLNVDYIQKTVASFFNLKVTDLKSKKRKKVISFPRQIAMYLARELTSDSFPEIGSKFGGKDHSTVIHAVNKIAALMETDPYTKNTVDALISSLKH